MGLKTAKSNYVHAARTKGKKVVSMYVSQNEVGIRIKLDDFIEDLLDEIGSVTWQVSNKNFRDKVKDAASTVMSSYKAETVAISEHIPTNF